MTGGIVRFCALVVALLGSGTSFAARVVDPATARAAISSPAVAARDASLTALAARGQASELAARIESIARDATLADVAREWLLDRGLHALSGIAPTPAARASVTRLGARAPTVFTRVDPEHGERAIPLYDAGATARFVLRNWERSAARAAATAALAARDPGVVSRYAAAAATPAGAGIADAFRDGSREELAALRGTVADALSAGRRVDALGLILAEQLADAELFVLLLDYAGEREALAAVAAAGRVLDGGAAVAALQRASRRADIASAAVLEIGRLAGQDPAARRFLFDALADPGIAPSAAAALARLGDDAVVAELGRRLASAGSEEERRVLVLALRLDGGASARADLERFLREGGGSPALRAKTLRWLER
jgi:hypothetical protein